MNLPRGLSIQNGYLRLRVYNRGIEIENRSLGLATPERLNMAKLFLSKLRDKLYNSRLGLPDKEREMLFADAAKVFMDLWPREVDAEGNLKHSETSARHTIDIVEKQLLPFFATMWFDAIRPAHVMAWRESLLKRGLSGSSANRYQGTLAAVFSFIKRWSEIGKIEAVRCPSVNPVTSVQKSATVKRKRVLTPKEFSSIKRAFRELGDTSGEWICIYLLVTGMNAKDLRMVPFGQRISVLRAKTGEPINLPLTMMHDLDWRNWRKRWEAAIVKAGLRDVQQRDMRKTSINILTGNFDDVLVSQYAAHADTETTREHYIVDEAEKLRPLSDALMKWATE